MISTNWPPDSVAARVRRVLLALLIMAVLGAVLLTVYIRLGVGIPCLFYKVTGLYCPGCGGMRAAAALYRLDLGGALRQNALVVLLLPVLGTLLLLSLVRYLKGGSFKLGAGGYDRLLLPVLVLCVLFAVARNLPPFAFLAPF